MNVKIFAVDVMIDDLFVVQLIRIFYVAILVYVHKCNVIAM